MSDLQILSCVAGVLVIAIAMRLYRRPRQRAYPQSNTIDLSDATEGPDPMLWIGTWNPADLVPLRHHDLLQGQPCGHSDGHHTSRADISISDEGFEFAEAGSFDDGDNGDGADD